ncbi:hypothetical protein ONS95_006582 [Cadophora gregata]|uniref:uncharacterized protein n=1 Tax=Cadophora gregata TaxID=51156 RepID=UPI0026DC0117|nr:uncharacterized protein ONS95_006582 [Cadophora gregata]KAK0101409.1 hypothetical protein ONS95_006582 [Cadophora gregata]
MRFLLLLYSSYYERLRAISGVTFLVLLTLQFNTTLSQIMTKNLVEIPISIRPLRDRTTKPKGPQSNKCLAQAVKAAVKHFHLQYVCTPTVLASEPATPNQTRKTTEPIPPFLLSQL